MAEEDEYIRKDVCIFSGTAEKKRRPKAPKSMKYGADEEIRTLDLLITNQADQIRNIC